ncbi:hypothetical protein BCEP4_560042 [Burkholderia cepacia]|nr:hypothetical protein BCEP4_560042 [Burkholderia cepacia]
MVSRRLRCGIDFITPGRKAKENGKGQTACHLCVTFRGGRGDCRGCRAGRTKGHRCPVRATCCIAQAF